MVASTDLWLKPQPYEAAYKGFGITQNKVATLCATSFMSLRISLRMHHQKKERTTCAAVGLIGVQGLAPRQVPVLNARALF